MLTSFPLNMDTRTVLMILILESEGYGSQSGLLCISIKCE